MVNSKILLKKFSTLNIKKELIEVVEERESHNANVDFKDKEEI